MDDNLRRKANEAYSKALADMRGMDAPKSPLANMRAQQFAGINLDGNFCDVAPQAVQGVIDEIKMFAWAIPDKIERPGLAVLTAVLAILPEFCGTAEEAASTATRPRK